MWKEWGITHLCFEKDSNAYARVRDERVIRLAGESGVEVVMKHGRHLFDPEVVVKVNGGKGTMSLHQWQNVSQRLTPQYLITDHREGLRPVGSCQLMRWDVGDEEDWESRRNLPDTDEYARSRRYEASRAEREVSMGGSRSEWPY